MRLRFESQVSSWSCSSRSDFSDKVEILSYVLLRVSSRSPASAIALQLSLRSRPRRRNALDAVAHIAYLLVVAKALVDCFARHGDTISELGTTSS